MPVEKQDSVPPLGLLMMPRAVRGLEMIRPKEAAEGPESL